MERRRIDNDTWLLLATIALAIGFNVFAQLTGSESRIDLIIPLAVLFLALLSFLIILLKSEKRLDDLLKARLPPVEYMKSRSRVETETLCAVNEAREYIIATGGRSQNIAYMKAIERRVSQDSVPYWRILFQGECVASEMRDHLLRVIGRPNAHVAEVDDRGFGNILVTEQEVVIALPAAPNPGHDDLFGVKIGNSGTAKEVSLHLHGVYSNGKPLGAKDIGDRCDGSA